MGYANSNEIKERVFRTQEWSCVPKRTITQLLFCTTFFLYHIFFVPSEKMFLRTQNTRTQAYGTKTIYFSQIVPRYKMIRYGTK